MARGTIAMSPMKSGSFRAMTRCLLAPRTPLGFQRRLGAIIDLEGTVKMCRSFGLYRSGRVLGLYRACQRRQIGEFGFSKELREIRRSCGFDSQTLRYQCRARSRGRRGAAEGSTPNYSLCSLSRIIFASGTPLASLTGQVAIIRLQRRRLALSACAVQSECPACKERASVGRSRPDPRYFGEAVAFADVFLISPKDIQCTLPVVSSGPSLRR